MIQINELRIGNVVYNQYGKMFKLSFQSLEAIYYGRGIYNEVILTPEILEKCRFKKDENGDFWVNLQTHYLLLIQSYDYFYPVYAQVPELSNESEHRVSVHRIKYLSQLQNLYYCLTGKELEVTL